MAIVLIIGLFPCAAGAQLYEWPAELVAPETESGEETGGIAVELKQEVFQRTFTSENTIALVKSDSADRLSQNVNYSLSQDEWRTRNQALDLSGEYRSMKALLDVVSLGVDWTPLVKLHSKSNALTGQDFESIEGDMGLGPTVTANVLGAPLTLRGGLVGRVWDDDLDSKTWSSPRDNLQNDAGGYGGFQSGVLHWDGGENGRMYGVANAYGQYMETARFLVGNGYGLYVNDLATGDRLVVHARDSVTDGRKEFLVSGVDQAGFINPSRRRINRMRGSGALRIAQRGFASGGVILTHEIRSTVYPHGSEQLNDSRNEETSLHAILACDSPFVADLRSGLRIGWEREDKLFKAQLDTRVDSPAEIDSLEMNINDYTGYRIEWQNRITKRAESGWGVEYVFDILRYSRDYPQFFIDAAGDTVRNPYDNDWITSRHQFDLFAPRWANVTVNLYGVMSTIISNYLKKERSGSNKTDQLYRTGCRIGWTPSGSIRIDEHVYGDIIFTEYMFPASYINVPPPMGRSLSSTLKASWDCLAQWGVFGEWEESYSDEGAWHSIEYFDTTTIGAAERARLSRDYYGIQQKLLAYHVTAGIRWTPGAQTVVETGVHFDDDHLRQYLGNTYVVNNLQHGYELVPFLEVSSLIEERLQVRAVCKRSIDTIADDFWDISIQVAMRL